MQCNTIFLVIVNFYNVRIAFWNMRNTFIIEDILRQGFFTQFLSIPVVHGLFFDFICWTWAIFMTGRGIETRRLCLIIGKGILFLIVVIIYRWLISGYFRGNLYSALLIDDFTYSKISSGFTILYGTLISSLSRRAFMYLDFNL